MSSYYTSRHSLENLPKIRAHWRFVYYEILIESMCVISAAVKINEYDSNNAYEISSDLNSNDSMMAEECAWVLGMVGGLVHVALAPWVPSGISCLGSSYWGIHLRGDNTSHFSMLSVAFGIGRLVSHSRSRSSHVRFNSSVSRAKSAAVHTHSRVARVPGSTWAQMITAHKRFHKRSFMTSRSTWMISTSNLQCWRFLRSCTASSTAPTER